jgi:hypothetical protein
MKMCEDFAPNFGVKGTGSSITTTHRHKLSFSLKFFLLKATWLSSSTFLFPNWIYRHFDTIEVTEAESQAVLNTLTEHDFQYAFKDGRSARIFAYARKGLLGR